MKFIWSKKSDETDYSSYGINGIIDFSSITSVPNMILRDENGYLIDVKRMEYPEQCISDIFIEPTDVVLELGARYGSVSCIINKKLSNKNNQVSVEPDETVWKCLQDNINTNDCSVNLHLGFLSQNPLDITLPGYGAVSYVSPMSKVPYTTLDEIEKKYNLKFDTLVADCEGFLETFFRENPIMYSQLKKIIFEADYPQLCDYNKIRTELLKHGFTPIITGFQNVYIRL